jgi:tRNA threonylcarbamoyladenosine biosynthesis protein TsaE
MNLSSPSDADLRAVCLGANVLQMRSASAEETRRLGARLAKIITNPESRDPEMASGALSNVIALTGNLGSGKTTFVQGFCQALGVKDRITSPTFTLMHVYRGALHTLYHFDFYRLASTAEIAALGCEEYFDSEALSLIEWPELAEPLLPPRHLRIRFSMPDFDHEPEARLIEIARHG